MIGYVQDTNVKIFKAMTINNGQWLYFVCVADGGLID